MSCVPRLLVAFLLVTSFRSSTAVAGENTAPVDSSSRLDAGFKNNDFEPLASFLEDWHKSLRPLGNDALAKKPEFEREAYAIYQSFFTPSEKSPKKYIIVQEEVKVTLVDDDMSGVFAKMGEFENVDDHLSIPEDRLRELPVISHITLHDFRPALSGEGLKVLCLDRSHLNKLLEFLVIEPEPQREIDFMPLAKRFWYIAHGVQDPVIEETTDELADRKRRLDYLNSQLNIIPGHWGCGWHFETHPLVRHLYLSRNRSRAVVEYRTGWSGGEAYLQKNEKNVWEVVLRDTNWTE